MGVTGTRRGNDYGGDEGCLFGWGSIIRHIQGSWESVKALLSQRAGHLFAVKRDAGTVDAAKSVCKV